MPHNRPANGWWAGCEWPDTRTTGRDMHKPPSEECRTIFPIVSVSDYQRVIQATEKSIAASLDTAVSAYTLNFAKAQKDTVPATRLLAQCCQFLIVLFASHSWRTHLDSFAYHRHGSLMQYHTCDSSCGLVARMFTSGLLLHGSSLVLKAFITK